ncbi:peptidase inhibitor 15 [Lingula anatina]|uniref:Peptidase inhibitor 15 n=1 Tax=Lingula anatina TaxID=7574 RepID=A0A1S3H296_LINAN|nr:peptidase inhibitor 15 [Lingula anatina]|eukprot:XP_013380067.1 peptidase inhibitor 15 [Lingula anatina]
MVSILSLLTILSLAYTRTLASKPNVNVEIAVGDVSSGSEHKMERVLRSITGYSNEDKMALVNQHNQNRRLVSPTAANMKRMIWDDSLGATAQAWANGCVYSHSTSGLGENLYARAGSEPSVTGPVDAWFSEKDFYTYNMKSCDSGKICGHYTQVAWAKSNKVGCGIKYCTANSPFGSSYPNWYLVVCNYSPAGNYNWEFPYVSGAPCSGCADSEGLNTGDCRNGLCVTKEECQRDPSACSAPIVCNNQVINCQNGGTANYAQCQCDCPVNYGGAQCEQVLCSLGSCQNGGTANYASCKCDCPAYFGGQHCESYVDCHLMGVGGSDASYCASFPSWYCSPGVKFTGEDADIRFKHCPNKCGITCN